MIPYQTGEQNKNMKFKGMLICTDLDGTLLKKDKTISAENLNAIEYFKREGGLFTFITGRMPYFVSEIYNTVEPNVPFGCINGGGLFNHRTQQYLWAQRMDDTVLELVKYIYDTMPDMGIQVNTLDLIYFCRENPTMEGFRRATGVPNIVRGLDEIDRPIGKIVFGDHREERIFKLEELLRAHPLADRFDFIRSERTLFEILPPGIHKGTALNKLCELLSVDPKRTIAIGDYNNDIGMLRTAGVGVAVANASPDAKAAADYITVHHEDHAIAAVIDELDHGRLLS